MKIKRIILMLIVIICLSGCTNIYDLGYDDIVNKLSEKAKPANTYRKGYQLYIPKGLSIEDAGNNYVVVASNDTKYYLYIDLVSYNAEKKIHYKTKTDCLYSKKINYEDKVGYVEIKLWENNQYLIEIMYNYAKIEVMVNEDMINKALVNSINILNSVRYNDIIIENLLNDDNLTYTEEIFDIFEDNQDNSDILDYVEEETTETEEEVKDTDYIN